MAANGKAADDGRVIDLANVVDDRLQEARDFGGFRKMVSGRWYTAPNSVSSTGNNPSGEGWMYVSPLWIPHAATLDRISAEITTAGGAGVEAKLCLYGNDPATDLPDALISDYGLIGVTPTGEKEIVISESLTRGLYWVGFAANGGVSFRSNVGSAPPVANMVSSLGGTNRAVSGYRRTVSLATWPTLPATFGASTYPHGFGPRLPMRAS